MLFIKKTVDKIAKLCSNKLQTKKTHFEEHFMQNLQVHYTYKTKNAIVQDLCIVQSKTKRFTKTQQLNTQLKLATQLNLKHFYAVTLTHYSVV